MAKVDDLIVEINGNMKGLNAELGKAGKAVDGFNNQVKGLSAGMKLAFAGIAAAITGATGAAVVAFGKDSVKAFGESQAAVAKLNAVLMSTGRAGGGAAEGIQNAADALMAVTTFDDDAIVSATSTLASFAKTLSGPELANAEKVIVSLASKLGIDLDTAARVLAKALSGSTAALGRYGIHIDKTASASEKLNQIWAQTNEQMDVQKAKLDTLDGSWVQLTNYMGENQERIGALISEASGLNEVWKKATELLKASAKAYDENKTFIDQLAGATRGLATATLESSGIVYNGILAMTDSVIIGITSTISGVLKRLEGLANGALVIYNQVAAKASAIPGLPKLPMATGRVTMGSYLYDNAVSGLSARRNNRMASLNQSFAKIGNAFKPVNLGGITGSRGVSALPVDDRLSSALGSSGGGSGAASKANQAADATKKLNDEMERAQGVVDQYATEISQQIKKWDEYIEASKKVVQTEDEKRRAFAEVFDLQLNSGNFMEKLNEEMTKSLDINGDINKTLKEQREFMEKLDFPDFANQSTTAFDAIQDSIRSMGSTLENTFVNSIMTGKFQFTDFANSVIADIARITTRLLITEPLTKGLTSFLGSALGLGQISVGNGVKVTPYNPGSGLSFGNAGSFFGIGKAGGGKISSPTIVGERGPELFVPDSTGSIVNNSRLRGMSGGSGVSVTNVIHLSAGATEAMRAELVRQMPSIQRATTDGVLAAIQKGGRVSRAVGARS